ncbi:MAG: hypothetical protein D6691_04885 [Candidatus Hydrogenedentota bacterium]|nr:MAG: hypothetical protein D6691_04885 [Candidatus Hydrogenedentota bacterium]
MIGTSFLGQKRSLKYKTEVSFGWERWQFSQFREDDSPPLVFLFVSSFTNRSLLSKQKVSFSDKHSLATSRAIWLCVF